VSYRERVTNAIGKDLMGGGGKQKGQVDEKFVGRGRHNFLFDNPEESGAIVARWLIKVVWPMFLQDEVERSKEPLPKPKDFQQGFLQRTEEVRSMPKPSKL
jgi:hypothetical protein